MEKSLKIALLFSGQIRNIDARLFNSSLRRFVAGLDADVYISTWESAGVSGNHDQQRLTAQTDITCDVESFVSEAFRDTNVVSKAILSIETFSLEMNDKQREIYNSSEFSYITINSLPQLYQIKKCYELTKDNRDQYDFFVRCRLDSLFVAPLKLEISTLKRTHIYHINFGRAWHPERIYDIFFIVPNQFSEFFTKVYDDFHNLVFDDFSNGLDARDACRILYVAAQQVEADVETLNFRYCDVKRDDQRYFKNLVYWLPFKKLSLQYIKSFVNIFLKSYISDRSK